MKKITLALDRYDRHVPLFLGAVRPPPGIDWEVLEVGMTPGRRDGTNRHHRMLIEQAFDVCEVSLASYMMAKERGLRMTAVPVFPRRLFSQNHIYVNSRAGIRSPADLAGKRIGLWAFQVTMSVLAKGDLGLHYGVPWRDVHWVTAYPEEIPLSFENLPVARAPEGADISQMLIDGELDALISPMPSAIVQARQAGIRRLFADVQAECRDYFSAHGYYPVMHLLAVKEELVEQLPELPRQLIAAWEASKALAYSFYDDPGYSMLAFTRNAYEAQAETFGADLWPSGLAANRPSLERFLDYMLDQQLLASRPEMSSLFHASVLDT